MFLKILFLVIKGIIRPRIFQVGNIFFACPLTHRESMSDAMLCLKLNSTKLFHLGIGKAFDKSTISRANENRDWRIFQDFGLKLISQAKDLYQGSTQLDFDLEGNIFALDSTTVDLCLDIFW